MNKNVLLKILALSCMLILQACGGGGDDDDDSQGGGSGGTPSVAPDVTTDTRNEQILLTGVLIDAGAVSGVDYTTPTQSGETDLTGEFEYLEGEDIQFSLGSANLGNAVLAGTVITTPSISGGTPTDPTPTVNLTQLLQTLDVDGDPTNGIEISNDAVQAIENNSLNIDLIQTSDEFASNADILTLISNGGQTSAVTELVDPNTAGGLLVSNIVSVNNYLGAWEMDIPAALNPENETFLRAFLIFLDDSTFVFGSITESDFSNTPEGHAFGLEWGTYAFVNGTASPTGFNLDLSVQYDTNGSKGIFDSGDNETFVSIPVISFGDNDFVIRFTDESVPADIQLTRSPNSNNDIVGLWLEDRDNANELPTIQFFPNGTAYFIEDPNVSEAGVPFIEMFRYDLDLTAGTLALEVGATSNPNATGTTGSVNLSSVSVLDNLFTFAEDGDTSSFTRVTPR